MKISPFPLFHKEMEHLCNGVTFPYAAKTTGNSVQRLANCRRDKTKAIFCIVPDDFYIGTKTILDRASFHTSELFN